MESLITLIALVVVILALLIYAIIFLIQQFKSDLKDGRIATTTAFVILFSLIGTYLLALIFKKFNIVEQVGSADAWIGFASVGMSNVITMLVLYFTLKPSIKANELSERILTMEENRYKLELRPFVFLSNWEAYEISFKELIDNPTKKYIQIGEYKIGTALGISMEFTNTTQSCISVSYSCGKARTPDKSWGYTAVNQENLKMTLSPGDKDRFVFYASPNFMKGQLHNRISVELILENRFAEKYIEKFDLIITGLSDEVFLIPGKWHCSLIAQEYTIEKL